MELLITLVLIGMVVYLLPYILAGLLMLIGSVAVIVTFIVIFIKDFFNRRS